MAVTPPIGTKRKWNGIYDFFLTMAGRGTSEAFEENVDFWGSIEIEKECFTYLFTIKNYSLFSQKDHVFSPVFRGGPKSQHQWQMRIRPKHIIENKKWFCVYLYLVNFGDGDNSNDERVLNARVQFNLIDAHNRPIVFGESTLHEFKKNADTSLGTCVLTSSVLSWIVNDKLKIHCRVWIEDEVNENSGSGIFPDNEERFLKEKEQLQNDFGVLLESQDFADVTLNTRTKTFKAHKAVLTSRSKVFAAMLKNEMLESSTNIVDIPDFEEDIVEEMLKYMYTGKVGSVLPEKALELFQIADKYDLSGLMKECEYNMVENLTVENSVEVLILAHRHNASVLKPKAIKFINRNKKEVERTNKFQTLKDAEPELLMELYFSQD